MSYLHHHSIMGVSGISTALRSRAGLKWTLISFSDDLGAHAALRHHDCCGAENSLLEVPGVPRILNAISPETTN